MIYTAIAHEVMTRLRWHAKAGQMLSGLNVQAGAAFRIDTEDSLPLIAPTDMQISDVIGSSTGEFTLFLRTSKEDDFSSLDSARKGLMDWVEVVMDAIETPPSAPEKPDTMLIPHKSDGTAIPDVHTLLSESFTWDVRMAEITPLSYMMQLTIRFKLPNGRRAKRRAAPVTAESYVL